MQHTFRLKSLMLQKSRFMRIHTILTQQMQLQSQKTAKTTLKQRFYLTLIQGSMPLYATQTLI
jgi:hypothetical protein